MTKDEIQAAFHAALGASTIESSMDILKEAVKKSPTIGPSAVALMAEIAAARLSNAVSQYATVTADEFLWTLIGGMLDAPGPKQLIAFDNMLIPGQESYFELSLPVDTWSLLQSRARQLLTADGSLSAARRNHLISIVEGNIPYGITLSCEHPPASSQPQ